MAAEEGFKQEGKEEEKTILEAAAIGEWKGRSAPLLVLLLHLSIFWD